jgi:magnesium and cobalt transporter
VPKRNESVDIGGMRFQVLRADSRRLYTLLVDPLPKSESSAEIPAG